MKKRESKDCSNVGKLLRAFFTGIGDWLCG
jgi:hypothetical protein